MAGDSVIIKFNVPVLAKYGGIVRDAVYGIALRAGLPVEDCEDVRLASGEAFTNAVQYAYGGETSAQFVEVTTHTQETQLEVIIQDQGRGFTEEDKPQANDVGLGLGITFMQSLMDDVRIDSELGKGTTVKLTKNI